ncbi:unnamed protein product [Durusdinium trenchii]|uniref:Amino acid transporter transmembrane domain-containing protein n=1 Tax=Durusdinium trenchii TaxID=1381693 RepID=A0ABP0RC44_9DINO
MSGNHHGSTWLGTSWIMLTDVVGTSVLTFAGVAKSLGWVLTITFIISLAPVGVYTAILMSRTGHVTKESQGQRPSSMGEAARMTLGGDKAAMAVYAMVYGFAWLGQSSYILVLGKCLQGILFHIELCLPIATALSCLLCLPIAVSVRHLSDSVLLCFINLFLILAVLTIVMAKMYYVGRPAQVNTFAFAQQMSFGSVFGAASNVVYSYAGHWLYFELMAEMERPEQFPRVFLINVPIQVSLYLLVACWGYHFAGDKAEGYFLDNLPDGPAYRWASALLFLHVAIAFLVKNVVLARALHQKLAPSRVDVDLREPGGACAQMQFAGCVVLLLVSCWAVANSIPFFDDLLALIGSLLSGPISFIFPMAFIMGAIKTTQEGRSSVQGCQLSVVGDGLPDGERRASDFIRHCHTVSGMLSRVDFLACAIIASFILLSMVLGTSGTIRQIGENISTYGLPFACQARAHRSTSAAIIELVF